MKSLCLNNTLEHNVFCSEDEENAFPGLYESPLIRSAMFMTYMVTLLGLSGLGFILWFERSGQAGQYRTVINQLISFNIDQVSTIFKNYLHSGF